MGSNPSSRKQTSMNSKKLYMLIQEIKKGKPEVVKLIKGFPNWKELGIADNQWNLLHLASWYGNSQLCVELIRLGVDPNKQDFVRFIQHKETPLHIAAWKGNYKTMKALIEVSDVTMENIVNYKQEGKKAIDLALKNGHSNVVELIEKHLKETIFVYDLL